MVAERLTGVVTGSGKRGRKAAVGRSDDRESTGSAYRGIADSIPAVSIPLGGLGDCGDRVDDYGDIQWRGTLPWGRACMSARLAPQLDDQVAETVGDVSVSCEAGLAVDVADGSNPFGHPIELAEFTLEGGKHRKTRDACCLIALVKCQVAADDALNNWRSPVEGPVACDVCEPRMNLHELVVARRDNRRGKRQTQLVEASLDSAHRSEPNPSVLIAQPATCG